MANGGRCVGRHADSDTAASLPPGRRRLIVAVTLLRSLPSPCGVIPGYWRGGGQGCSIWIRTGSTSGLKRAAMLEDYLSDRSQRPRSIRLNLKGKLL